MELFPLGDTAAVYADVAIPVPLRRRFTYRVPSHLAPNLVPGSRVAVPFGPRKVPAIVLDVERPAPAEVRVRDIAGILDAEPLFTRELLAFLIEASDYYFHPIGEVLRAAAPAMPSEAIAALRASGALQSADALKGQRLRTRKELVFLKNDDVETPARLGAKQRQIYDAIVSGGRVDLETLRKLSKNASSIAKKLVASGAIRCEERTVAKDPFFAQEVPRSDAPTLNAAQTVAVDEICAALTSNLSSSFLIHGVTGSGKTEVYLHAIAEAKRLGRGAILLVPEIALTPQLVSVFRRRFGDGIAVLHSGLSERERNDAWRALRDGRVSLAIGARSAIFAPVLDLGVIIVDEEHDPSFKQEEGFRYHARDMALLRAKRAGAVCILGSATPSLESYRLASIGRTRLLVMASRATPQALPHIEIVDLRRYPSGLTPEPLLTAPLVRALDETLTENGQAILFLNRRGFSPSVRCDACGVLLQCPGCSVPLTEHRAAAALRCHYCDFHTSASRCPGCKSEHLQRIGLGTERLEHVLSEAFPGARVGRLDRDTASGTSGHRVLERFRNGDIDVLVGTQMVTKGHDIAGVTLVGVLLADQSLAFPDFRSGERTYQLISQVAGRAGRGERPGKVILQTYQPEHPVILRASRHDYVGFYQDELAARHDLLYSPFSRLIAIRTDAGDEGIAKQAAIAIADAVRSGMGSDEGIRILGPAAAPIARLRGRYRYRLLMIGRSRALLRRAASIALARIDAGIAPARASVDVDPVSML